MRVSDFFATKSATPATRAEAEAALRSTVQGDASNETPSNETPTTEIVSGEGDAVLHDTIVQDEPVAEGAPGFSCDSVPETVKSCGCPEGECRGANPEAVEKAIKAAQQKVKDKGFSPGDPRFGEIMQGVLDETFGPGIVTVSGPFDESEPLPANTISFGFDEDGLIDKPVSEFDEEKFFQELVQLIGKAPSQNTQTGFGTMPLTQGFVDWILRPIQMNEPLILSGPRHDPFPFFTALGRDEPQPGKLSDETLQRLHEEYLEEKAKEEDEEDFEQEGREVVQSLTATMEQLVRLATTVYGE